MRAARFRATPVRPCGLGQSGCGCGGPECFLVSMLESERQGQGGGFLVEGCHGPGGRFVAAHRLLSLCCVASMDALVGDVG